MYHRKCKLKYNDFRLLNFFLVFFESCINKIDLVNSVGVGGIDIGDNGIGIAVMPVVNSGNEPIFSGLYSYHVPTGTWTKLASDIARPSPPNEPVIRSRVGHSMLFHPVIFNVYL